MPQPEERLRRFTYIDFVGVCLVKNIRSKIVQSEGDFAECMEGLQQTATSYVSVSQVD